MNKNLTTLTASGSATGNPRNKTALKPGFSLVGWIRLGNSGEDLTGLKGKFVQVSHQELAKHNKDDDCWMAIRGKVYNVTRYLDYHPGGRDQLLRGAGKDATSLFDEAHAWVNIDQLLAKCYVGPLRNTVTLNLKDSSSNTDLRTKLSPPSSNVIKFPSILSVSSETLSKGFGAEKTEIPVPTPIEIIPRFDWIQKSSNLSIFFYTKSFCNPGISIENICDKECEIKIFVANTSNRYKFSFLKPLNWPCSLKNNLETGKIEITFEKVLPELWSNFGIFERTRRNDETFYSEYLIAAKNFFNHNSFELTLRPKKQQMIHLPVGYHLNFRMTVLGADVIRSYTPIPEKYIKKEAIGTPLDIHFLIKTYNDGTLTKHLSQKSSDEVVSVSQPKGNLDLNKLKNYTKFVMIAAGSGITPIISVMEHLLERNSTKIDSIDLLFFNKSETDIWLRDRFEELQKNDSRFKVKHILSEPDKSLWTGDVGRITKDLVEQAAQSATFALICGPKAFNDNASQLAKDCQLELHCFQG